MRLSQNNKFKALSAKILGLDSDWEVPDHYAFINRIFIIEL